MSRDVAKTRQFSVPTSPAQKKAQEKVKHGWHEGQEVEAHERARVRITKAVEDGAKLRSHEHVTPLGVYLASLDMTVKEFAEKVGIAESTMADWMYGKSMPDLVSAFELERLTRCSIPMESWLATPRAVVQLRAMSRKQPVNVSKRGRLDDVLSRVKLGNLRMDEED